MGLNISKGNIYGFIDRTWNPIKGKCFHDCSYCYMKAINKNQREADVNKNELKTDLTKDRYVFVGSSTDLFAENISSDWIKRCLNKCYDTNNNLFEEVNKYFFQSKNPKRFLEFIDHPVFENSVICTTIETNKWLPEHMRNSPKIEDRVSAMEKIANLGFETHVTIEPIMDFDLDELLPLIKRCKPV
jgi:DNA repair photolyase